MTGPGGDGSAPQQAAMARAAMQAFSDIQAQFAARAGLPVPAVPLPAGGPKVGGRGYTRSR